MPGSTELELDQLWFTWSRDGLGAMPMGYRVRAASEGLHNLQDLRYRRLDRFLRYELPQGTNTSEFDARIAPISLSFVHNGYESLLIRKVFKGRDYAGRNSVFFAHLIAGLPPEFTAFDAIRLWYCPSLWRDSDADIAPNVTTLRQIPYSELRGYVEQSQTQFNFSQVSEKLQNLLLLILSRGLPQRITVRGHSTLIAALIYGLTHTLPTKLLSNLTFTTYESNVQESEALIAGTINGAELQNITQLQVQPNQATGPVSEDIQRYVTVAINSLLGNNTEKLYRLIDEIERRDQASVDNLIELFKHRFRFGGLTVKQLEDIILHPTVNVEDLLDPAVQMEAAQLLLNNPDYWEQRGKEAYQKAQSGLVLGAKTTLNEQAREALSRCLHGMADYVFSNLKTELMQGSITRHSMAVLTGIAHPSIYPGLYQQMLTELAQEPLNSKITSDELWPFHYWLLSCTKLIQPLPTRDQMLPWLSISAWDKLDRVLKLDLPTEWEYAAMFGLLKPKREIPKLAISLFKAYETKFTAFMQDMLQQGSQSRNQDYIVVALRLFKAIIKHDEQATKNNEPEYTYPRRVDLLLILLNAVPNDASVIEAFFSIVRFASPYQLTASEFSSVVEDCPPELFVARSTSPSLMTYIQEFILSLTPKQLMHSNTLTLLEQLQQGNVLAASSDAAVRSVHFWLVIHEFLMSKVFDDELLQNVTQALTYLVPHLQQRGQDIWHTFIEEMAPYLVNLVENEYQLGSVLYVFAGARVVSAWDLLNALAIHAGETLAEDLPRLIPYLLCGIREYARSGLTREALDAYLQRLFKRTSENTLNDVDKATSIRIWPDLIITEWKGWRERSKSSFTNKIPFIGKKNKSTGDPFSQVQMTGTSHTLGTSQPDRQTLPLPNPALPVIPQVAPQQQAPNLAPPAALQMASQQHIAFRAPQEQRNVLIFALEISININNKEYTITINNYERVYRIWVQVLQYWPQVLNHKLTKSSSKVISYELRMIMLLEDELKRIAEAMISDLLIQYFVDDILINFEIERICKIEDQPFLHPTNYIPGRLEEFKSFVGLNYYQVLCKNYTEEAIKDVLEILIRRYHLVQYMDAYKKDCVKWLSKEQKSAKYKYQKVQTQAKNE